MPPLRLRLGFRRTFVFEAFAEDEAFLTLSVVLLSFCVVIYIMNIIRYKKIPSSEIRQGDLVVTSCY